MPVTQVARIPLSQAAQALHLRYHAALNAVLVGELEGQRQENGRGLISAESVEAYRARRQAAQALR